MRQALREAFNAERIWRPVLSQRDRPVPGPVWEMPAGDWNAFLKRILLDGFKKSRRLVLGLEVDSRQRTSLQSTAAKIKVLGRLATEV